MKTTVRKNTQVNPLAKKAVTDPLKKRSPAELDGLKDKTVHIYGNHFKCCTDSLGMASPLGKSPAKLVLDTSDGFVPLWAKSQILKWRFQQLSLLQFENQEAAKTTIRDLMGEALLAWGDAAPIRFSESTPGQRWDFEVVVREQSECDVNGCVLASAFFPDGGQHELVIYPTMFEQSHKEQVETLVHEFGHVFGLRHFFAKISESQWSSEVFGTQSKFTIMNYGADSRLTKKDKSDLKKLYSKVWSKELEQVNGTPIRLFKPYSAA